MLDRYGEPPASTLALLDVAMLRGEACAAGIRDISQRGDTITFTFGGDAGRGGDARLHDGERTSAG